MWWAMLVLWEPITNKFMFGNPGCIYLKHWVIYTDGDMVERKETGPMRDGLYFFSWPALLINGLLLDTYVLHDESCDFSPNGQLPWQIIKLRKKNHYLFVSLLLFFSLFLIIIYSLTKRMRQGNSNICLWFKIDKALGQALNFILWARLVPPSLGYSVCWVGART